MNRRLVQGEEMRRKNNFPALILFLAGFLAGNILPDVLWRMKWQQKTIASVYFLTTFTTGGITGTEYLKEIFKYRGSIWGISILCGFSVFGAPLAVLETWLLGAYTGAILAVSILQFGLMGGATGIGLLMPQYLFYIPAALYAMKQVWGISAGIWKNKGLFPDKIGNYMIKTGLASVVYLAGMLSECYLNPWIVEKLLKYIKIF